MFVNSLLLQRLVNSLISLNLDRYVLQAKQR